MWNLQTIIRINNEKDSAAQGEQETPKGDEGELDPEEGVFGKVTYVRSVYEGEDE
jgi:hypothetical protein